MSEEILHLIRYTLLGACNSLERYDNTIKKLSVLLKKLQKDPSRNKKQIQLVKHHKKATENFRRGAKANVITGGESMINALANLDGFSLNTKQLRYWNKFNSIVMRKWEPAAVPLPSCQRIKDFIKKYGAYAK